MNPCSLRPLYNPFGAQNHAVAFACLILCQGLQGLLNLLSGIPPCGLHTYAFKNIIGMVVPFSMAVMVVVVLMMVMSTGFVFMMVVATVFLFVVMAFMATITLFVVPVMVMTVLVMMVMVTALVVVLMRMAFSTGGAAILLLHLVKQRFGKIIAFFQCFSDFAAVDGRPVSRNQGRVWVQRSD